MSLMQNPFDGKDEVIFITYDDVIKTPFPFLLNKINEKLSSFYEPFLDLDKIKGLDMNNLNRLCVQRTDKQIFRFLAKTDFDVDGSLKELHERYFEVYEESPLLATGHSLIRLLSQKFTKKVYIHTDVYDMRVHLDIQNTYNDMDRVNYVTGDLDSVLKELEGITTYMVADMDHVVKILRSDKEKLQYINILMAQYGYNYIFNDSTNELEYRLDVEKLIGENICKFATFMPIQFKDEHFSQVPGLKL